MAIITEAADKIYEIRPEGKDLDHFPLSTVYLVVDDKMALVETGCPVQATEILEALETLGYNAEELSYIIPTHVHGDHAGGVGVLAQKMPRAHVLARPKAAKLLADPSVTERLMQSFKHVFGDDAEERFGKMPSVPHDKFEFVEDGESVPLGRRELKVIHTPGHSPNHLCLLDTISKGVFSGDALGAYFSDLEVIFTCPVPGSDPLLALQSMENLHELKPEVLFFSHGCATRDAARIIKSSIDQARRCHKAAYEALKAGEDKQEIARRITEIIAGGSARAISDFSNWPYLIPMTVGGYQQYFKKNNMI